MRLALLDHRRAEPSPGAIGAECPYCHTPVIARCGTLRAWHWAHLEGTCDSWLAPDTEWTLEWKSRFNPDQIEVLHNGRLADIKTYTRVIELVQIGLVPSEIAAREETFSPMVWLVDARTARIGLQPDPAGFVRFTWTKPKTNWLHAAAPVILDLGDEVLLVRKMRTNAKGSIRGWGVLRTPTVNCPLPATT